MKTMKHFILLISLALFFKSANSQVLKASDLAGETKPAGKYEAYVNKNGDTIKVGDTLKLGMPSGVNGKFLYITRVDVVGNVYYPGQEISNSNAVLKNIRVGGTKRTGWKPTFQTQGATAIDNYFFFYEDAVAAGEVKSIGITSDEALSALQKAKSKLDLGLITQEEYEKQKAELSKYIK